MCQALFLSDRLTGYCSAFEMLRYPGVKASDLKQAVPELHDVDEGVLGRVDIDGEGAAMLIILLRVNQLKMILQANTMHTSSDKKPTCGCSWKTSP